MTAAVLLLLALLPQLVDRTKDAALAPPSHELSHERRADIFMARKMYREGVETYQLALQQQESPYLYNKLGIAYHHLLMFPNATRSYQKAVKLDSEYSQAINNLGAIYYAQRKYKKAIRQYKKAIKENPNSASIHSNLGTAYFARKKYKNATAEYLQALQLDPRVFERRSTVGTLLQERNVRDRAQYNYFMAKTYASAELYEKSLLYLRRAFEEGYKKRKKVAEDPIFAPLLENPVFQRLVFTDQTAQLR
jgi:tetratricopeptide (TPR) repeat protein